MADFNAQIQLGADAKQAYREITKVERKLDQLDRSAGDIDVKFDIDRQAIRRAEGLLRNLERTRKVKLQVDE